MHNRRHALVTHLGVGDGIIQSGLAVALLSKYDEIAFPCYPQYLATFKAIFAIEPRITVYTVERFVNESYGSPSDATYKHALDREGLELARAIRLGVYSGRGIGWDFSKSFYEHARIDYSARWRYCPIARACCDVAQFYPQSANGSGRTIFLHDDQARGFAISRRHLTGGGLVISPTLDVTLPILRYARAIIDADEVHCIDSSFFWLADSLMPSGRLFLHKYARWERPRNFMYETYRHWNVLESK